MADDEDAISDENPRIRGEDVENLSRLACQDNVGEVNRVEGWVSHGKIRRPLKLLLSMLNRQESEILTLAMVRACLPLCRLSGVFVFGNGATVRVVTRFNSRLVFDAATGVFVLGRYPSAHFSKAA